jgi:hypothetical protein
MSLIQQRWLLETSWLGLLSRSSPFLFAFGEWMDYGAMKVLGCSLVRDIWGLLFDKREELFNQ